MVEHAKNLAIIDKHREQPDVTTSAYFHSRCLELGRWVVGKRRIYLDTCYWVHLRQVGSGKPQRSEYAEILRLLRSLVQGGHVICPVSDATFIETVQQTDLTTRLATADLFDELSAGVATRSARDRVPMEMAGFMRFIWGERSLHHQQVWVRAGMVLGAGVPSSAQFSDANNRLLQKAFIDAMWATSFRELAEKESTGDLAHVMANSALRLNEKNDEYALTIKSFKNAFANELSGSVRFFDEHIARTFLAEKFPTYTEANVEEFMTGTRTMLFNAFRQKPELMARHLPALYVHAAFHAAIRWDKKRRLDGHWLMDFHHACAACGYHKAMFTETPLKVLMTSGNLRLDREFELCVLSDPAEVLGYLRDLATQLLA